jgi:hypothetical protein
VTAGPDCSLIGRSEFSIFLLNILINYFFFFFYCTSFMLWNYMHIYMQLRGQKHYHQIENKLMKLFFFEIVSRSLKSAFKTYIKICAKEKIGPFGKVQN